MDGVLAWGLDVVRAFQGFASPAITAVMGAISFAGSQWFMIGALVAVYWCVDSKRGARMALLVSLSAAFNAVLKIGFAQPRPYDFDRSVGLATEETFAFPSGHSQNSATFFGSAMPLFGKGLGWVLAIGAPLLIGVTRVYLGVHFPTDVLAGWVLGAVFVALERFAGDRIEETLTKMRESVKLALAAALALGMNATGLDDMSVSGSFFGLAAALVYAPRIAPFSAKGTPLKKLGRLALGAVSLAIIYFLPKLILTPIASGSPELIRFIRYAMLGAWGVLGAPWLFIKLKLAERG
ncbi:MAG: phosphatase PAP2 family protein [Spirochaetaceae bacterium]|nr:phosphatase PAP2 family protein [Spirochaetaceae bacterium]